MTKYIRLHHLGSTLYKTQEPSMILDESVLEDDYPIYIGYWYIADGNPIQSDIFGRVRNLRRYLKAKEIRRCDAIARNLPLSLLGLE